MFNLVEIITYLVLALIVYNLLVYLQHLWSLRNYPPGPFPVPIIGNLHQFDEMKPYNTCLELSKNYGAVFSMSFGMERVVIVTAIEPAREAMVEKMGDFAGRPQNDYVSNMITRNCNDLAMADYGAEWSGRRKLSVRAMKIFSDHENKLAQKITMEAEELSRRINNKGKMAHPIDMRREFKLSITNIIHNILFGEPTTEDELQKIISGLEYFHKGVFQGNLVSIFPWLRYFPIKSLKMVKKAKDLFDGYVSKCYDKTKTELDSSNITSFLGYLINASGDEKQLRAHGLQELSRCTIEVIIIDIFIAAIDSTAVELNWNILRLLHHPIHIEDALREIQSVVGIGNYPELKDRSSLPKILCIIEESMRLTSGPFSLQHKATKNSSLAGHDIVKGTQVLFDQWNIHRDERHWDDPREYKPCRWLDTSGNFNARNYKSYLPFLLGKRACLGEQLGRAAVFLILTRLIVDFKMEADPTAKLPKESEGTSGLAYQPLPYKVILEKRSD